MKKIFKLKLSFFIIFIVIMGVIASNINISRAQNSTPGNPAFGDVRFYQCVLAATGHGSESIEYNVQNSELEALNNFGCSGFSTTDGLDLLKNIKVLNLTGGFGGAVQTQNLTKLQTIFIDKSAKLTVIGHDNHMLKELTIKNGTLDTFDASEFKTLGNLDLSNNKLTYVKLSDEQIGYVNLDNNNLLSLEINSGLRINHITFNNQTRDIKLTRKDGKYELNLKEQDSHLDSKKVIFSNISGVTYNDETGVFTLTNRLDNLTYKYNTGNTTTGNMPVTINLTYSPEIFNFYLGSNAQVKYTQTKEVEVNLSWRGENITHYCLSETDSNSSCSWQAVSGSSVKTNHTFSNDTDGLKTLYAFVKNNKEEISLSAKAEITLDTKKPIIATFTIGGAENPEKITSQRTTISLTWTDEDVKEYCISSKEGSNNCIWQTTTDKEINKSYTLTSGNGTKTLYAYLKDKAGNISEFKSDSVTLEATEEVAAPFISVFYIGSSATSKYTNTKTPTIHLSWSSENVTQYCISKTNSYANCNWQNTTAQSAVFNASFTDGDGTQTLYAFIRSDDLISASKSASIILDTTKPIIKELYFNNKEENSSSLKNKIYLFWEDNDVASYCLSTTNSSSNCDWKESENQKNITVDYSFASEGEKTLYAYLKDKSGLISEGSSAQINIKQNNSNPDLNGQTNNNNNNDTALDKGPQTGPLEAGIFILALGGFAYAYVKINKKKKMFRL